MARPLIWVGHKRVQDGRCEYMHRAVFRHPQQPTQDSHCGIYDYVVGPFRTVRAAKFMVHFGWVGNPDYHEVKFYERLALEFAETMKGMAYEVNTRN